MAACSTGSPASRRLTKLTPLTTRPFITSRQGIIRLASIYASCRRQRFHQGQPPFVERHADYCSRDYAAGRQTLDFSGAAHAAGSDDRQPGLARQRYGGVDVDACKPAIAADVRIQRVSYALFDHLAAQFDRGMVARLLPAVRGDFAVLRI